MIYVKTFSNGKYFMLKETEPPRRSSCWVGSVWVCDFKNRNFKISNFKTYDLKMCFLKTQLNI
jgi:hypothetical protein